MDYPHTFKKPERISYQREIDRLFEEGNAFISYPLRVVYLEQKPFSGAIVSVLIGVPKKKIKHAVKRNRMKRLIREAYRLNKNALVEYFREKESGLLIAFLFIGNELYQWKEMEAALRKALDILKEKTE
ncbi:MAG: ribonuclease P protein component [Candidatus Azobacteroides sp.]|nr:ribonuclease P protein component [Candidatus Azobacteroides sp.]